MSQATAPVPVMAISMAPYKSPLKHSVNDNNSPKLMSDCIYQLTDGY